MIQVPPKYNVNTQYSLLFDFGKSFACNALAKTMLTTSQYVSITYCFTSLFNGLLICPTRHFFDQEGQ